MTPTIAFDSRVGRTVAGSDYTKPGRTCWRVDTYVESTDGRRFIVDQNESIQSAEQAMAKATARAERHGGHWMKVYGYPLE